MDILRYPIYNKLHQLGLLGLHANVVYDVIPTNPMALNDPVVNATVFDVNCGLLPEARQNSSNLNANASIGTGWLIATGRSMPKQFFICSPRE